MLSLRAYARHRAARGLPGATLSAVQRAIREGRIKADSAGKIDPNAADLAWANNTRMMAAESRRPAKAAPGGSATPSASGGPTLARAQLAHELVRVKKASIEVEQLEGTLVNAHDVVVALSDHITTARNRFLVIRDKAANKFGEECGEWFASEIRAALTELSAYKPVGSKGDPNGNPGT